MATAVHSDSGPQALNGAFIRGEVITVNTNSEDVKVHFRAVVNVAGDDLIMLVQVPTYGADGAHDGGWAIESYRLGVGEVFVFEKNAGVFLKHAAAVASSGAASDGGCTTYAVFDIALSDKPPPSATWAMPPPTELAAPIADASWPPPDAEATSMAYWAKYREERSALSFLSPEQQRDATTLEAAIHVERREARASANGQLPATAVALTAQLKALLKKGRRERGLVGEEASAESFLDARELEQLASARAEGREAAVMALIMEGRKGREEASAAACLNAEDHDELERARADGLTADVERLLAKGRKARSDLGAVACLEPEDKIEYESALDEGRMGDVERLLEKARSLLGAKGGKAAAGVLKPQLSTGELKDPKRHCPSHTRGEFTCKWNCKARASTLNDMCKHYRRVTEALKEGRKTPCKCTGPLPAPALCAVGGAVDAAGTAAAAGSSADASALKRKRQPPGWLAN